MAGTNDFKAFATGGGANVLSQAAYAALTTLIANGFQAGVADSQQVNKVLRQAVFGTAALGEIIKSANLNATDDGNLANFVSNLQTALAALVAVADASTSTKGKVQLATSAEAQALTDALKAITPATLASILGAGLSGTNGYATFPYKDAATGQLKSLIVQWGKAARTVAGDVTVTFPIAFPNAVYSAVSVPLFASAIANTWKISSMSQTSMVLNSANAGAGYYENWIAIGN